MVGAEKMSNIQPQALYDNIAESPDELAFRKGDILSVLEQNTGGIEGWWLCSLRGRQGICPGNRLRILPGVFEVGDSQLPLQTLGKRRSWHVQPNMVLTPQKFGDIYLYDLPPQQHAESYDIPRPIIRDDLKKETECYDTPRALNTAISPSSSASSLIAPESLSLPSSNRSSLLSGPDYDVPKPSRPLPNSQVYDVPASGTPKPKELPLEITAALDILNTLQTEAANAITKLLGLVSPTWRTPESLQQGGALEIKLAALRLRTALHEFSDFCAGALGNAFRSADHSLAAKMSPLSRTLSDADAIVHAACAVLDESDWAVDILLGESDSFDELDRIVAVARPLTEDVRRSASFIQGNAPLLFRKEEVEHGSDPVKHTPEEVQGELDVSNEAEEDAQILKYYAALALNHSSHLTEAIDAFLKTVEHNRPPNVFLAHGKLVVLSAHRLVHVGDTVARNLHRTAIKQRVQEHADGLSQALDQTVQRTKRAAQHFPSVAAVQDMVDAVVDISHYASDLRRILASG